MIAIGAMPALSKAHRRFHACVGLFALLAAFLQGAVHGQTYQAPPRTVEDILAVLDQYKPNPKSIERERVKTAEEPPPNLAGRDLARFFYERGISAGAVGDSHRRIADFRKAFELVGSSADAESYQYQADLAGALIYSGNLTESIRLFENVISRSNPLRGLSIINGVIDLYEGMGDANSVQKYLRYAETGYSLATSSKDPIVQALLPLNTYRISMVRARSFQVQGKYDEAELAYRRSIQAVNEALGSLDQRVSTGTYFRGQTARSVRGISVNARENAEMKFAEFLIGRNRLVEAEVAIRDVLRRRLIRFGKENAATARLIVQFSDVLKAQGRYLDALQIAQAGVKAYEQSGAVAESLGLAQARRQVAEILVLQMRWKEALEVYQAVRSGLAADPNSLDTVGRGDASWGLALVKAGQAAEAVELLTPRIAQERRLLGDSHPSLVLGRGVLAMALTRIGDTKRALAEFRAITSALLTGGNSSSFTPAQAEIVRHIIEGYIDLLLDLRGTGNNQGLVADALAESFRLSDIVRGSQVQRALSANAARAATGNPDLSALARKEQDLGENAKALHGYLLNQMQLPRAEQSLRVIEDMRKRLDDISMERRALNADLQKRFPNYANLINPGPVTLQQARSALKPGEALISVYVGQDKTYVWAIPHEGAPAFAAIPLGDKAVTESVAQLRKALDIGNTAIARFPRFDIALAHRLYNDLLKPVETGWKDASSLIIVPHRALGQLPFSLLVTAPADVAADTTAPFDGYRTVPWLLRKAAVTQLPSVNALTTLRALPAVAGNRREFIGFGDPYFSKIQQAEAAGQERIQVAALSANLRNLRIDTIALPLAIDPEEPPDSALRNSPKVANSSTLAQLARLPETADEIRDIAQALKADISKDVFLGVQANEKNVKSINLADRKVIAFATHGLIPGDLNGLEQPALALTAPDVAGIDGDGLLTMEEILALKLNADWVVLSACNTGTGDGAGSEAISGLGRAFFYAGARSLLVSNWPVETNSARLLTADVFKRSAGNPTLTRAEALRQTMLWLMDNAGQRDASGKMEFTYAHPMFWAPFALIGDGGR